MEKVLHEAVVWSLEKGFVGNGTWLAERLWASRPRSQGALELLATCHLRAGRPAQAYALLRPYLTNREDDASDGAVSETNRFLFAQACFRLDKLKEAYDALLPSEGISDTPPLGAAGFYLLGQIMRHQNQRKRAVYYLRRSLELQPFLWTAYEALCALGEDLDASLFFQQRPPLCDGLSPAAPTATADCSFSVASGPHPFNTPEMGSSSTPHLLLAEASRSCLGGGGGAALGDSLASESPLVLSTPRQEGAPFHQATTQDQKKKVAGRKITVPRRSARLSFSALDVGRDSPNAKRKPETSTSAAKRRLAPSHQPKFSSSPSMENTPALANRGLDKGTIQPNRFPLRTGAGICDGKGQVLRLLQTLGNAYRHLCQFRCEQAVAAFGKLPTEQYATGWVMCQVARAHFEMVNYTEAEKIFDQVRSMESARTADMEVYSTILWHLRKEVNLSHLAQQLIDADKLSPQAWCALGNCFSLHKEHPTAIKFFQRATQVDRSFAYGHTLCGHEYVASDELEKALACFRSSLRIDPRHYNAWAGILSSGTL